jgi:hypothetical protein
MVQKLDFLRDTVIQDLEVRRGQSPDRLAVAGDEDVRIDGSDIHVETVYGFTLFFLR